MKKSAVVLALVVVALVTALPSLAAEYSQVAFPVALRKDLTSAQRLR